VSLEDIVRSQEEMLELAEKLAAAKPVARSQD